MSWFDGLGGAFVSGAASLIGGREANAASAASVDKQMEFQERMSSSAHQREVSDLRAAGLNPILSAKYGGASSPSGASYQAREVIGDAARSGVSTAMAAERLEADLKNLSEQNSNIYANTAKTWSDKRLSDQMQQKAGQETENLEVLNRVLKLEEQEHSAAAARARDTEAFFESDEGSFLRKLQLFGEALAPIFGNATSARSLMRR